VSASTGTDLRTDDLTGARTFVVDSRQDRPNLPTVGCPFCPGGLEAPQEYAVHWFENRWPAMPDRRCEVVLYTAQHDATFWSLGVQGARQVIDVWAERSAALGARPDVAYVLVFENRGAAVGAIAMAIIGFSQFGWMTSGKAELLAQERASTAVVAALVPFCIAKAQQDPDKDIYAKLQAETSSYSRSDMVMKAGWATVGDERSRDNALARACSEKLTSARTG